MSPEAILAQSYKLLAAGDPLAAETALAPLWNATPDKPPKAMHLLALIRRAQNRLPEAEQWLRSAIAAEPGDHEAHYNLGDLLHAAGSPDSAVDCFRTALRLSPQLDLARLGLVRALTALARGAEAERESRALLARKVTPEALRALGGALNAQGRTKEALEAFEEALRFRPGYLGAQHDRALALQKLGRSEEALKVYAETEMAGVTAPELALSWAMALVDLGRLLDAEEVLERAVAKTPHHVRMQADLARLRWMRSGDPETFAADLETAVADRPANEPLRAALAELLYRADSIDYAQSVLRDGLTISPESAILWRMLGFLLDESGRPEEAVAALERAFSYGQDAETRRHLAHALLRIGEPDRALEQIRFGLGQSAHDQIWLAYLLTAQRMRGDAEYERLFDVSTCVRVVDLAPPAGYRDIATFNAAIAPRLDALHGVAHHSLNQTIRNGTQTLRDLSEVGDPAIDAFLALAKEAVRDFATTLPDEPFHPFFGRRRNDVAFSGAWSVRLRPGGRQINHVHPKGWISSAYYVRLPNTDPADPKHAGWLKLGEPRLPIPNCPALGFIEPRIGRLVLFPSYLWHGTEPFARDDRLTVAFDAVPV
ncbi:MAG: tetratricopeptide repeat protein [Alphaproteobacteria bacterium]|nr:tetratricopeptide repeat protein [Alphaproteobacteria bacterium]